MSVDARVMLITPSLQFLSIVWCNRYDYDALFPDENECLSLCNPRVNMDCEQAIIGKMFDCYLASVCSCSQ